MSGRSCATFTQAFGMQDEHVGSGVSMLVRETQTSLQLAPI